METRERENVTPEKLEIYLNIYVARADWQPYLRKLWKKVGENQEEYWKAVTCAILFPYHNRSFHVDKEHPEGLLLGIFRFDQFKERDWVEEFREVIDRDAKIREMRKKFLHLGVIDPIEFAPYPRQAYNWLRLKAEETNVEVDDELSDDFKRLVHIYGGAVICNVFTRHAEAVQKVLNWRSGYFFERSIYQVHNPEEIYKIKKAELDHANEKLIRKL